MLFVKTPVTGVDIYHRVANAAAHKHLQERIRKLAKRNMRHNPANADNIIFILRYDDLPEEDVISKK